MKYVMFEVRNGSLVKKIPIIFPNDLVHREVANAFAQVRYQSSGLR